MYKMAAMLFVSGLVGGAVAFDQALHEPMREGIKKGFCGHSDPIFFWQIDFLTVRMQ